MTRERDLDGLLRAFMAAEADAAVQRGPSLEEAAAAVATRLGGKPSASRSLPILVAATLLLSAMLATALAVGSGILRFPSSRDGSLPPPGSAVAYAVGPRIMLGDVESGQERQIATGPRDVLAVALSPNGDRIAYIAAADFNSAEMGLWVADVEGGDPRLLTTYYGSFAQLEWSPDGSRIAVPANFEVLLVDPTGRAAEIGLRGPTGSAQEIHWHPDGDAIIAVIGSGRVEALPLDGGQHTTLLERVRGYQNRPGLPNIASVSAEGRTLAVARQGTISIVDLDTGEVRERATESREATPALSPDGRWLAAVRYGVDSVDGIYIGPANARADEAVRVEIDYAGAFRPFLTFSPGSDQLLIGGGPGGRVWRVDVATGRAEELRWSLPLTPVLSWPASGD